MDPVSLNNQFQKYGSIENLSTKKYLNDVLSCFPDIGKIMCVVLEKAHGAHFSFQVNKSGITCARRNEIIADNENFFDHVKLLDSYRNKLNQLYDMIVVQFNDAVTIQIDGELIGGDYPHETVEQFNISRVQKGVYYCPNYEFYAYDIKYCDAIGKWKYINYDVCMNIFKTLGFWYAKPLTSGMFNDIVNYDPTFQTTIPDMFGLPRIDNNIAEGVVIKPIEPMYLPNGSRVIFKNKTEKFNETLKDTPKKFKKIFIDDVPADIKEVLNDMVLMVTDNRLNNVISKIGQVNPKDKGKLIGLLARDVLKEFEKIYNDKLTSIDKQDRKIITKKLSILCESLVMQYFQKI